MITQPGPRSVLESSRDSGTPTRVVVAEVTGLVLAHRGALSILVGLSSVLLGWTLIVPMIGVYLGVTAGVRHPEARGTATWGILLNGFALGVWVIVVMFSFANTLMWTARA
ncbi:hypothetical protein [Clavibacter sp. VKM Ac-2872]|uniref:hypothetical protein n=1 Tax=Clavibacter sp. VKM Ac-2872 TaxID=2783812 RepID=UPI00188BE701|nr:hypothetical protein [Clavibacter sp. VKM Ac-2872]MBF4625812.1 hypothetical protein [Clavibacter sp. VKM Ac-2872]